MLERMGTMRERQHLWEVATTGMPRTVSRRTRPMSAPELQEAFDRLYDRAEEFQLVCSAPQPAILRHHDLRARVHSVVQNLCAEAKLRAN